MTTSHHSFTAFHGHCDNSGHKKWAVIWEDDSFLLHEDGWGHNQITTFKTKEAAEKKAKKILGDSTDWSDPIHNGSSRCQ